MLGFSIFVLGMAVGATAQSINPATISVAVPSSVFVLPVVYVTTSGDPAVTAASSGVSDPMATSVYSNAAQASAAAAQLRKRNVNTVCAPQPSGIAHSSNPDTPAGFVADPYYAQQAVAAAVPSGYIQTFTDLNASNSALIYNGYTLLSTYSPSSCASMCSSRQGCNAFNIYFERDPTLDPNSDCCANPPSTINIKCVFWGDAITVVNANNFGQLRNQFKVLIAGSNGYVNTSLLTSGSSSSSISSTLASSATASSLGSSSSTFAAAAACTSTYQVDNNGGIQLGNGQNTNGLNYMWQSVSPGNASPLEMVTGVYGNAINGSDFSFDEDGHMIVSSGPNCGNALAFDPAITAPQKGTFVPLGTTGWNFANCWVASWSDFLVTCGVAGQWSWTAQVCQNDGYSSLQWALGDAYPGCQWVGLYYHTPNNPNTIS